MVTKPKNNAGNQSRLAPHMGKSGKATAEKLPSVPESGASPFYSMILELIEKDNCAHAFQLLKAKGEGRESEHLKAICQMRLGKYPEAIKILRELVLNPGCTWMRDDAPLLYKTNYATALMLGGHPAGCRDVLAEINRESHPLVVKLREAIRRWERTLTLWERLKWRWFSFEPKTQLVKLDFEPGDLSDPL